MFTINAANTNLLTYDINTSPEPLQVSPASGSPMVASLTIVASNTTSNPIYVESIKFSFSLGDLAQNLTDDGTSILVSASPSDDWDIQVTSTSGTFVAEATPLSTGAHEITTDGLVFQIYSIQVNKQVGTASITIQEESSTDGSNYNWKSGDYSVSKFPYGFYVNNFTASKPLINNGDTVTLTWNGADEASYHIIYSDQPPVDVSNFRSWTSPALTNSTNFILQATVQSQGETVNTYLNTTVFVANPDVTANSLNVSGASQLSGATTVGTSSTEANLTVNGDSNISGNLATTGTLGVTGDSTLAALAASNISASGTLGVSGNTTLADLALSGALSLTGTAGILGSPQSIAAGTYTAPTDGFAIGYISGASQAVATIKCVGWIYGATESINVTATGGNNVYYTYWDGDTMYWGFNTNPSNFCIPVRKGQSYSVSSQMGSSNTENPSVSFWYVPIGSGTSDVISQRIGDAPTPPKPEQQDNVKAINSSPDQQKIKDFLGLLLRSANGNVNDSILSSLTNELQNLLSNNIDFSTEKK